MPLVHALDDTYFEDLEKYNQQVLGIGGKEPECDDHNKVDIDTKKFNE